MAAPVVALKDIRLADGPRPLFSGVDLALQPRVRACLVGRNGAGKSTLLRILTGQVEPDAGERTVTPGVRIAYVPQEPPVEADTILDYCTQGGAQAYEAEAWLTVFGLDPAKSARGLSGGEIRRAALARAFAEDPDVLLLDEPTNHLDILAIETLESELVRARAAVLVVSHDRAFLERVTGRCFWLDQRRVRRLDAGFKGFDAWAEKLLEADADVSRRLQKALEQDEYWLQRGVTARRARNEGRRRRLMSLRAQVAERRRDEPRELTMAVDAGSTSGKLVAEAKAVAKRFGERTLLSGFSTRIMRGDRLAVVGPNGAGKTTLIKLLLGELEPDAGSIRLGVNLEPAYVDQARAKLPDAATLWQVLAPHGDQIMVRGNPKHVAAYAKEWLFTDAQLRQPVHTLSGGERNRLLLARALANPTNLLVLDEPTNDLDMDTLDRLEDLLADYEGTLLLVSHDRDFIDRLATSTIALDGRGRAVETPGGWTDFVRQNPGFFTSEQRAASSQPKSESAPPIADRRSLIAPKKLSFKDAHRLRELDNLLANFPGEIADLEARLADPALYARNPAEYARLTGELERLRAQLGTAEDEWLALEEKREALAG
jgi:ATP-binding cassette subfamily F protein uup